MLKHMQRREVMLKKSDIYFISKLCYTLQSAVIKGSILMPIYTV